MMFHSPIITVMTLWLNIFLLLTMAIFLSDFPITASNAIDCFSHIGKNGSGQAKPLVISYKGPSGDYPACTDLAYEKAISDSVDVRDCPVQMTKDGIPICLGSIDLLDSTNVAQSPYSNFGVTIPELKSTLGIFTFNLTWPQIQSLRHLYMVLASHN